MNLINTILGTPLGYLMYFCYKLAGNYAIAIILFTFLSKVVLFPLSLSVQKNSVRMVKLKPKMDEIKKRHAGDKDRIADEQIKLYGDEKYSPALGCLPTLIQLPFILGLIYVIYNPLQHLLHISKETIGAFQDRVCTILDVETLAIAPELKIIEMVQAPESVKNFSSLQDTVVGFTDAFAKIQSLDLSFFGLNLSETPSITAPSLLVLIPIFSGLAALLMCVVQNHVNVLQREQSFWGKWGMTIFLTAFSTYFPFMVPAGVGLYWIFSSLFAIPNMLLLNVIHDPKKYIDYSARPVEAPLTIAEKKANRQKGRENFARSRRDNKRFYAGDNENKQLVFYSVKSGFYKYFETVLAYILQNSDITVHYVTSDPEDAIFRTDNPKLQTYYIGEKALIPFMMKMDADMVVMTMPDLQKFHIKRSLMRKDIEYVYIFHTVASMHMTLREGAVDHYDTVFCVGPHQMAEIRKTEGVYDLPAKKLIEHGYSVIDNLLESYRNMPAKQRQYPQILIAPSWQEDNILESCIDDILEQLLACDYYVIVRPHPEFVKRFPNRMEDLIQRYRNIPAEKLMIETDFSSNATIYQSDILITDWSNIAFEYSYCTKKPTLFINTPMKIMNPEYELLDIVPLDITLRDEVGVSVDLSDITEVSDVVSEMLANPHVYADRISSVVEKYLYNIGTSGEAGGRYIVDALNNKKHEDDQE